jgi:hypothetical protein
MTWLHQSIGFRTENRFARLFSHRHRLCYVVHSLLVISILVPIIKQMSLTICKFSNRLDKKKRFRLFIAIFVLAAFAFATAATTGAVLTPAHEASDAPVPLLRRCSWWRSATSQKYKRQEGRPFRKAAQVCDARAGLPPREPWFLRRPCS